MRKYIEVYRNIFMQDSKKMRCITRVWENFCNRSIISHFLNIIIIIIIINSLIILLIISNSVACKWVANVNKTV